MFSKASREREPDTYMPYIGHATPNVIILDDGSLLAMFRVQGVAFELADPDYVSGLHAQLNILLRNIASDRLALYSHVVRTLEEASVYPTDRCASMFARSLDEGYRARLMSNRLYRNELFLSVLLRATSSAVLEDGSIRSLLARRKRGDTTRSASAANLELLGNVVMTLRHGMDAYGVSELGLRQEHGVVFSELAEALRLVLTGEHLPVPVVNGHLGGAIYTDRVIVGREAIEVRGPGGQSMRPVSG
jgi:type IV secretion system protein VirB4